MMMALSFSFFFAQLCISLVVPGAFVHLKRDRFKAACNLLRTLSPILSQTHTHTPLTHYSPSVFADVGERIGRQIESWEGVIRVLRSLSLPRIKCIACTVFHV